MERGRCLLTRNSNQVEGRKYTGPTKCHFHNECETRPKGGVARSGRVGGVEDVEDVEGVRRVRAQHVGSGNHWVLMLFVARFEIGQQQRRSAPCQFLPSETPRSEVRLPTLPYAADRAPAGLQERKARTHM